MWWLRHVTKELIRRIHIDHVVVTSGGLKTRTLSSMSLEKLRALGGSGRVVLQDKDEQTGIAIVRLDQPERHNAISATMMANLAEVTDELEQWSTGRGVVIWGGPKTFSSGADLGLVRHLVTTPAEATVVQEHIAATLYRLSQLPLVSVALVTGLALGGGAELAAYCDFRLMARDSAVGFIHKRLGVTTGWGGGSQLVRLVGRRAALQMLLAARRFSADEALQMRFADTIVAPGDEALIEAVDWLKLLVDGDVDVVRATKRNVVAAEQLPLRDALINECATFGPFFGGPVQLRALQEHFKL